MNDFSKGNARAVDDGLYTVRIGTLKVCQFTPFDLSGMCKTDEANASLTATAFTAATKLAEQGYDAVKLISLLPEIAAANSMNVKVALIKQCEVE